MSTPNNSLQLPYNSYFATVKDLWSGKFIGGTFGANYEGFKYRLNIDVRNLLPLKLVENDDTDLQLLWLHALEEHGIDLTSEQMVQEWREHVHAPWSEYGVAIANWERGITPPASGHVDNWFFGNAMGCPIRSEIWAMICPGLPEYAARYARRDAVLDHHEDSVEAEIFLAALQSAIFVEKDIERLIDIGLEFVDPDSRFARLVSQVLKWSREHDWETVHTLILRDYGHPDFTNSPQNMASTILALLHGKGDFIRTINIAINCGYDTDCTAATAGAIVNAIHGSANLPDSIRGGLQDTFKVSSWMRGFPGSGSLETISQQTCRLGLQVVRQAQQQGDTDLEISDPIDVAPSPLPVEPQEVAPLNPVANPFPRWNIFGPFFRDLVESSGQRSDFPDHGNPNLPSCHYMTHNHSGYDRNAIDPRELSSGGKAPAFPALTRVFEAEDSRLLINEENPAGPGTYFAHAAFDSPAADRNWLMAGSNGPVEIWLNGERIIASDTYQPLAPTTFDPQVTLREGRNHLVLKLEKTSQPVAAFIQFKRHSGQHWHQCFINTSLNWVAQTKLEPAVAGG